MYNVTDVEDRFVRRTWFPSRTCLREWRKNEMKTIQHDIVLLTLMNTTHGMKYLHITKYLVYMLTS